MIIEHGVLKKDLLTIAGRQERLLETTNEAKNKLVDEQNARQADRKREENQISQLQIEKEKSSAKINRLQVDITQKEKEFDQRNRATINRCRELEERNVVIEKQLQASCDCTDRLMQQVAELKKYHQSRSSDRLQKQLALLGSTVEDLQRSTSHHRSENTVLKQQNKILDHDLRNLGRELALAKQVLPLLHANDQYRATK